VKYIGVKMLDAKPMDLGAYNKYRGWTIPENENPESPGYLVRYPDGYESWSPHDTFEAAYYPLADGNDRLTSDDVRAFVPNVNGLAVATLGHKTTVVQATCLTGFEITKSAACVSEENYDEKKGMEIAMTHIENDLWGHLGFVLQWALNGLKRG